MTRPALLFLALAVAAIAGGCDDKAPNAAEVRHLSQRLVKPLPGLYRSTTTLKGVELPGADPQTADMLRDKFAQVLPQTRENCLTPAQAERGFEGVIAQAQQGNCTIEKFVPDDTRLAATMRCRAADGVASTITVEGTAAPDRSHVELQIAQSGATIPGGRETIALVVDSTRIGECPAAKPSGNPGG